MHSVHLLLCAIFIVLFAGISIYASEQETSTPQEPIVAPPLEIDRYPVIWQRSPFTLATTQAVEQNPGTWVLVGLAGNAADPVAILYNRDSQERRTVRREVDDAGMQILEAVFAAELMDCRVRVQTRSEIVEARFDKQWLDSQVAAAAQQVAQQPAQGRPQSRTQPNGRPVNPPKRIVIPSPR